MNAREVYVQDAFVGADPRYRRSVRAYTETAWASIFVDNLFIRPTAEDLVGFVPNFTIIDAPSASRPIRSATARAARRSSWSTSPSRRSSSAAREYAGEIKKGAFGIMNYRLPDEGVLPMHAASTSARTATSAIFFGLSGTGKTTL